MINAIIIDDEVHCIETLEWELKNSCPEVHIMGSYSDPVKAAKDLPDLNPDLVFLDIEMPNLNAFEFLNTFPEVTFDIIFTTAYDEFATKAFKVSAIDYLLKPIDSEELSQAVEKATIKKSQDDRNKKYDKLFNQLQNQGILINKIALPTGDGIKLVKPVEILYCKAESNYTHVYLHGQPEMLISKTLKDIEGLLKVPGFYRVHNSYLINLQHVDQYVKSEGGHLVMSNGDHVSISRNKKDELLQILSSI